MIALLDGNCFYVSCQMNYSTYAEAKDGVSRGMNPVSASS